LDSIYVSQVRADDELVSADRDAIAEDIPHGAITRGEDLLLRPRVPGPRENIRRTLIVNAVRVISWRTDDDGISTDTDRCAEFVGTRRIAREEWWLDRPDVT